MLRLMAAGEGDALVSVEGYERRHRVLFRSAARYARMLNKPLIAHPRRKDDHDQTRRSCLTHGQGGNVNSEPARQARSANARLGGRPKLYQLVNGVLERRRKTMAASSGAVPEHDAAARSVPTPAQGAQETTRTTTVGHDPRSKLAQAWREACAPAWRRGCHDLHSMRLAAMVAEPSPTFDGRQRP
jgi:hypothetical protein